MKTKCRLTLVIFSIFLTDFNRSSISRNVAMLRADLGAAPSGEGWDARRASERLANIEKLVNLVRERN
jgi:hypothetical protein